ncbi:cytochrome c oxidase assembly protein COX16-domain-containing protein [Lineolata rhizophorae]|uniref:Cytochrome c oxidase assembly protein COX16, mitochondrial n=1 Tax=Lineolata rhizophorae TaxID=578093 RepID=A0A6A6P1H6_9PEZI|nr:cytochrome c oxidase assembly protein COX16-domain-containing protein [Lineolata rhizophorae]
MPIERSQYFTNSTMPTFPRNKYYAQSSNTAGAAYRRQLPRHPFLLFGLPFVLTIVAGSFILTPATAVRYEHYDNKVRQVTQEEAMGLGKNRRKVDIREEYFRLADQNLDEWEQKRVERLPGEPDGVL